jgi:outer membrane receptor protein involved in Fe transport
VTDDLTVTPRFLYQQTTYNGFPYSDHTAYEVPPPAVAPTNLNLKPNNFMQTRLYNIPEGGSDRWWLSSLTLAYHTGFGDFISSSSYLNRRLFDHEDASDAVYQIFGAPFASNVSGNTTLYEFVQEVRFVSNFSGPIQLVSGVYYQRTSGTPFYQPAVILNGLNEYFGGTPQNPAPGTNPLIPDELIADRLHTQTSEPALYGEVTYQATKPLKLTVGARVYRNKATSSDFQEGFASGGATVFDPPVTLTQSGVNPKVEVDYQVTRDKMVYTLASKGFRPGGVSAAIPSAFGCPEALAALGFTPDQVRAYKSDSVWNYEVGAKTSWLDQTLTANVAAFYINWKNLQQSVRIECGSSFTGNAGAANS